MAIIWLVYILETRIKVIDKDSLNLRREAICEAVSFRSPLGQIPNSLKYSTIHPNPILPVF